MQRKCDSIENALRTVDIGILQLGASARMRVTRTKQLEGFRYVCGYYILNRVVKYVFRELRKPPNNMTSPLDAIGWTLSKVHRAQVSLTFDNSLIYHCRFS
jgi:hypothetical protein